MSEIEEMFPDFGKYVGRSALFLGAMLLLYMLSHYYVDAWIVFFLLGGAALLALLIVAACIPLNKYIAEAKAKGTITERDEFWGVVIIIAILLFRR